MINALLHTFRITAGITSNASPYKGWEDPTCELRGHFAGGHFLSAAALSAAGSGNSVLQNRGNDLVAGLAQCQKKMGTRYLSAFPSELFDHLSQGKPVWAPFYTYHKIMAGLLDMYTLTGNTDALQIAEGMAQWVGEYWVGISNDQRQRMLRTEYGGMNEVLVNLADLTKKQQYIDTAHVFEQPGFLDPLASRRDELQGLHANTHVPKIIGAARMYEVTGDRRYRQIAEYFLEEVLSARNYAIGNTSLDEHWRTAPGELKGTLGWTNAECCVAYNLMKLERLVFGWTGDARWMDAYERALFNCRLGTQNSDGLKQYFFPLAAGYWRVFNSPDGIVPWCCTGSGAEEFAKFADTIYFRRGSDLFVNQFIASTLDWKEEGFAVEQVTQFHAANRARPSQSSRRDPPRARQGPSSHTHSRLDDGRCRSENQRSRSGRNRRPRIVSCNSQSLAERRHNYCEPTHRSGVAPGGAAGRRAGELSRRSTGHLYSPPIWARHQAMSMACRCCIELFTAAKRVCRRNCHPADPLPKVRYRSRCKRDRPNEIRVESKTRLAFRRSRRAGKRPLIPVYQIGGQRYSLYWQIESSTKPG